MRFIEYRLHALLPLVAAVVGCQAHGSARARVEAPGGEAGFQAEANVEGGARASDEPVKPHIRFVGGKLTYQGGVINFEFGKATLEGEGTFATLDSMRRYLEAHPEMKVKVEGHTDSVGSDQANLLLSRQRAGAVRGWLEQHGIASGRLSSIGYGESRPLVTNDSDEGRAKNRRVEFDVIAGAPEHDDPEPVEEPAPMRAVAREREAAEPAPQSESAPEPRACPDSRIGFHVNALGTVGWLGGDFAYQPACWLELAAGLTYRHATADANDGLTQVSAGIHVIGVPARARLWMLRRHSPIIDLGLGLVRYESSVSGDDVQGRLDYKRTGTVPMVFAGAGYGYRSEGAFRLALLLGVAAQPGSLDPSDVSTSPGYDPGQRDRIQRELDGVFDTALEPRPWFEASFGWLYP